MKMSKYILLGTTILYLANPLVALADENIKKNTSNVSKNEGNNLNDLSVANKFSTDESVDSWLPDKNLQKALLEVMKIFEDKDTGKPMLPEDATVDEITKELAQKIYQGSYDQDFGLLKNRGIKDLTGLNFFQGLFYEGGDLSNNEIETIDPIIDASLIGYKGFMNLDGNHIVDASKSEDINASPLLNQTRDYGVINITGPKYIFNNPIKLGEYRGNVSKENITSIKVDGSSQGEFLESSNAFQFNDLTYGKHFVEIKWSDDTMESRNLFPLFSGKLTFILNYIPPMTGNVTVYYQNLNGGNIADSEVLSGNVGDEYETKQKKIDGYTFKEVQGNPTGKFTDQEQTVTYVYTKDPVKGADVTAKYVDESGKEIAQSEVKSGNIGDKYTTEKKDIKGYTFKEVEGSITGTLSDKAQTVTYIYVKNDDSENQTDPSEPAKPDNSGDTDNPVNNSDSNDADKTTDSNSTIKNVVNNVVEGAKTLLPKTAAEKLTLTGALGAVVVSLVGIIIFNKRK
ncbi:MucBP domain-containing protein [Weissella coleopterorum]|uniref:MucBP domain-containing protein n=1 Tax=Weissella coleopterorum TaxID=2714949 RepID=A0A6G8B018_9LACO|nr:MucBP domain-containing protein [Weissella coleopterorum]QIL50562.1 MucBP domain-containing protein [Weissella coleopterorum]